ncbi:hypothetical protein LINPERHAP1_LOCUS5511, partial [Linum perenne]
AVVLGRELTDQTFLRLLHRRSCRPNNISDFSDGQNAIREKPLIPREVLDVYKFNLPSLNRANIKLLGNWHVWFDSSDYDARKQMLIEWCDNLFKILHNVQALDLQVETFELLIQICGSMKHQAPHFKRMKFLNLKCRGGSRNVPYQVIHYFLGGSPNEEDKRFTVENLC